MTKTSETLEARQLDYAWNWFSFHAEQRTKMFNFMLVVLGIVLGGFVTLFDKGLYPQAMGLSVFGMLMTLAFYFLDKRNRRLYYVSLDVLIHLEREDLFDKPQIPDPADPNNTIPFEIAGRLQKEDAADWRKMVTQGKHQFWMPAVIGMFGVMLLMAFTYGVIAMQATSQRKQSPPTAQKTPAPQPSTAIVQQPATMPNRAAPASPHGSMP